jgi:putative membrane protein
MPLLSPTDVQRIEGLIEVVEGQTCAEIVVIEAAACGAWAEQRAWLAGGAVLGFALAVHCVFPGLGGAWLVFLEALVAPLAWWAAGQPRLLSRLIPEDTARSAVDARARQLFAERGLYATRGRSGILVLISDLERRVSILADAGVNAALGDDEWRRDVDAIVDSIRAGRAADGLVGVIEQLGERLAALLPRTDDDVDELSDSVVRID